MATLVYRLTVSSSPQQHLNNSHRSLLAADVQSSLSAGVGGIKMPRRAVVHDQHLNQSVAGEVNGEVAARIWQDCRGAARQQHVSEFMIVLFAGNVQRCEPTEVCRFARVAIRAGIQKELDHGIPF